MADMELSVEQQVGVIAVWLYYQVRNLEIWIMATCFFCLLVFLIEVAYLLGGMFLTWRKVKSKTEKGSAGYKSLPQGEDLEKGNADLEIEKNGHCEIRFKGGEALKFDMNFEEGRENTMRVENPRLVFENTRLTDPLEYQMDLLVAENMKGYLERLGFEGLESVRFTFGREKFRFNLPQGVVYDEKDKAGRFGTN